MTARASNMWAGALRETGDLDPARQLNEEALEMAARAEFPGARVSAQIDLVFADLLEGEPGRSEASLPSLFEAIQQTKGWHQWLWTGRVAEAHAETALAQGRWEDAGEAAEQALGEALQRGRLKYACRARTVLGAALVGLDRCDAAAGVLVQATHDAERLRHLPSLWQALSAMGSALDGLGRHEDADAARERARRAVLTFGNGLADERRESFLSGPHVAPVLQQA